MELMILEKKKEPKQKPNCRLKSMKNLLLNFLKVPKGQCQVKFAFNSFGAIGDFG